MAGKCKGTAVVMAMMLVAVANGEARGKAPKPVTARKRRAAPALLNSISRPSGSPPRFFDKTNLCLFAGVAVARALDYTSTETMRARGDQEVLLTNSIVDNKPLFAGIEVAGFGASVALSYLFYRTHHYRLERWVSIIHIGVGAFGDVRNYTLPRAAPLPPQ